MSVFDISKPSVRAVPSAFGGGGWAIPLDAAGTQALHEFFGEAPAPIAPLGNELGYIVEPYQTGALAAHLLSCNVAWEISHA